MNADCLLAHFDRISDAPDAIPRLRRFILDLAVRGKLVHQDPNDEPASELLKRIKAEKARLVKEGEIRKEKPLPLVEPNEVPFGEPPGWEWVRIRQVTSDRGQTTPEKDFTYIDVTSINKGAGYVADAKVLSASDAPSRARKLVRRGDVLYSCVRPYLLNIAVIENDIVPSPIASTAFAVLNSFGLILSKYLWIALRSPFMVKCVEEKMRGQAYPAINDSDFALLPLPLPPLAEQHRIVAKVDELMALCDRLEAAQAERKQRQDRLAAASLHRLNNGIDAHAFREHVRFHLSHLPRLTTRPEHIQQLRQTILNLAVRGKLVPQDPNDEPASELLKRIQAEKERLIKDGALRKEKPLPPVAEDEAPFAIPTSWIWARIGTCSLLTEYGTSVKSDHAENGVPVLKMGDIQGGRVILGGQKKVPRLIEDLPQLFLKRFDLLYNRTNSAELVGKTGIYLGKDDAYTFASYLIRIRFINELTSPV
ncbi:MAG: hypothetical protein A3F84_00390 [Candidatus Handelsmanbacteria bacterium RIFCSPLOWO2_12_FULL_64_10]|uniref:Type I restriction modification DNA specificity domain-containing protein n=1 Tax=Handelsmanbacteria sp. (strain RIFCSPLOWO2_12_FULL_64_10) TaxID=1817868 RepID=A0A1F6CCE9_HANXR|nr:MAG: hypothetical protein A3F84_00390 [Candidatus Handelsmanbacteria bacterium RIFCSPLOWO2_12_FULL_64_10]